jgi:hypothetical protein
VTDARGQNTRMGGSDPTFDGFQPPKVSWGRSRRHARSVTVFWPRAYRVVSGPKCGEEAITNAERRNTRWQL